MNPFSSVCSFQLRALVFIFLVVIVEVSYVQRVWYGVSDSPKCFEQWCLLLIVAKYHQTIKSGLSIVVENKKKVEEFLYLMSMCRNQNDPNYLEEDFNVR